MGDQDVDRPVAEDLIGDPAQVGLGELRVGRIVHGPLSLPPMERGVRPSGRPVPSLQRPSRWAPTVHGVVSDSRATRGLGVVIRHSPFELRRSQGSGDADL